MKICEIDSISSDFLYNIGDFHENSEVYFYFFFSELKKFQIFLLKSGGFHTVSSALKSWDCEILSFSQVFHHFMMGASEFPGRFPEISGNLPGNSDAPIKKWRNT